MSSLTTTGVRGALAAFASHGTSLVARLASTIILARLLVPEYFGLVAIVAALAELASNIIQFGLPLAAAQADTLTSKAKSTLFFFNLILGLLFGVAFFISASWLAELYGSSQLAEIVRWVALVPLAVGLSAQFRAQMMRDLRFVSIEIIVTVAHLLSMTAAVAVAAATGSIYALVVLVAFPQGIQLLCFISVAHWRPGLPGRWQEARGILTIGAHIFVINLLRNISRTAVIPALGVFESPKNVGFYDRAYQLSAVPANTLMDSLQRIAVPLLARVRADRQMLHRAFDGMQTSTTLTLVTGSWVLAAVGEPLVVLALGGEWTFAGTILQVLAIGTGFRLMAMMEQWLFIGGQATGAGVVFSVWSQPLIIFVSLAGLPWGALGVATANALAWLLLWPLATLAAARSTGLAGITLLKRSVFIVATFSVPIALSAAVSRVFLRDPAAVVIVGISSAVALAGVLIVCRPSIRTTIVTVLSAAKGTNSPS